MRVWVPNLQSAPRVRIAAIALWIAVGAALAPRGAPAQSLLVRGDAICTGNLERADSIQVFSFLFLGGQALPCEDAADANDSGGIDISDGIYVLTYLFLGGPEPPPPYPGPGHDPTGEAGACEEWVNTIGMRFVRIEPGVFLMGSPETESGRWFVESPVHRVRITKPFYLGVTEVTQGQYERVMGTNPSFFNGGIYGIDLDRPVEQVAWDDAVEFCRRLSELEGRSYRLPTEAEWEYACRAGTATRFFFGDASDCDDACGPCPIAEPFVWWCGNNESRTTKPVATKLPNPWCLYDMNGNVKEWCSDWSDRYSAGDAVDPTGPETGEERVIRGGSFAGALREARSAMRGDLSTEHRFEFLGFRVAFSGEP